MTRMTLAISTIGCVIALVSSASAYDGNWRRGQVYYQGVCTPCHKATNPEGIPANSRTIAEWTAYMHADKHDMLKRYVSQAYRAEIWAKNRVAEKFYSVNAHELLQDIKAYMVIGAKDGDVPVSWWRER